MPSYAERLRALRFDVMVMRLMPRFRREIKGEKNRFIVAQMAFYKAKGRLSDDLVADHAARLSTIYSQNLSRIIQAAVRAAPLTISGLKSEHIHEFKYSTHETALRKYVFQFAASRIRSVAKTTASDVRKLVVEAFESGAPETDVIKAGLKARGLSAYRADTIARTETHNAAAFASRYTVTKIADDAGLTLEKKWMPTLDERTRPDHAAMADSDYIAMDQPFDIGGEYLDYPGDPSGSAEQIINCRCQEIRRVVRDYL